MHPHVLMFFIDLSYQKASKASHLSKIGQSKYLFFETPKDEQMEV
jgi:hypothetical protein